MAFTLMTTLCSQVGVWRPLRPSPSCAARWVGGGLYGLHPHDHAVKPGGWVEASSAYTLMTTLCSQVGGWRPLRPTPS